MKEEKNVPMTSLGPLFSCHMVIVLPMWSYDGAVH